MRPDRPPVDPTDYLYGIAVYIERGYVGTELVGDHASGVQVLTVVDTSQIPDSGEILVGPDVVTYDSTTSDEDPDATVTPITIHLPAATSSGYDDRTQVLAWPLVEYKTARVQLDDPNPADPSDPVEVHVPPKRMAQLKEGPAAYQVRMRTVHGRLEIDDVLGRTPELDLSYGRASTLDPSTLRDGITDAVIEFTGTVQLGPGSQLVDALGQVVIAGDNTGMVPSAIGSLQDQLNALKASSGRVIDGGYY